MRANTAGGSRPAAAFLRHVLLVLLAAFALAELPFGAHEGAVAQGRLFSAFAEERRISEPADRHSAADAQIEARDCTADGPPAAGVCADADPAAGMVAMGPLPPAPVPAASGFPAPRFRPDLPPCKAIRSRAPPALA